MLLIIHKINAEVFVKGFNSVFLPKFLKLNNEEVSYNVSDGLFGDVLLQ